MLRAFLPTQCRRMTPGMWFIVITLLLFALGDLVIWLLSD